MADFLARKNREAGVHTGRGDQVLPILRQLRAEDPGTLFSGELVCQLLSQLMIRLARAMETAGPPAAVQKSSLNQLRTVHIDRFLNNSFYLT